MSLWVQVERGRAYVEDDQPDEGLTEQKMLSTFSTLVMANLEEAVEADGGIRAKPCDSERSELGLSCLASSMSG
jgi:hypothetical protein